MEDKQNRRVVITGMGIWSCLGTTLEEVKDSLYNGKSGIIFAPERKEMGFESGLTAFVKQPELKGLVDRAHRVFMPEEAQYAYMATVDALKMAKLDQDYLETHDVGLLYGNDSSADAVVKSVDTMRNKKNTRLVGSGAIFQSMNSTVTMNLGCLFKLRGINMTVSAACASGSHAIGLGSLLIKWGLQDCVVCGGAQEVNPFSIGSFDGIGAFSKREDAPENASRPFDAHRDGLVPGGGAATVVIETYVSAVRRGAPIIAEVAGYGFSSNGGNISQPSDVGSQTAMERALAESGLSVADIDYVNAHATSTPQGDAFEAIALDRLFGSVRPPISSTKSMTGHECWMAGASEIVYSTLMMQRSFVAPNINFETPDEHSAKLNIATKMFEKKIDAYLSNSFGFGGTNSALVVKKLKP